MLLSLRKYDINNYRILCYHGDLNVITNYESSQHTYLCRIILYFRGEYTIICGF